MTKQRLLSIALTTFSFAVFGAAMIAPPALADITGAALSIRAVNAAGDAASIEIPVPAGASAFTWASSETMEMRSPRTGELIALLNPNGLETSVQYVDDPQVSLAFAVQAGSSTTTFFIASALLSFPTMTADGRASAGFSVTDVDGDGVVLTGIGDPAGTQGAYLAQYNGFAGSVSGTTFAEVVHSLTAGALASGSTAVDVPPLGFLQIVDPVSDISVMDSFSLSANDLASGTSTFVIVERPLAVEPATWGQTKVLFR